MANNQIAADIEGVHWSADALERLDELRAARDLIDYMIDRDVAECRATAQRDSSEAPDGSVRENLHRPITWETIAKQLGISRQSAWQRYRHTV